MKLVILVALIAFAAAAPVDDKKPVEGDNKTPGQAENNQNNQNNQNKQPAADAKKPEEKKEGLEWPLPDPINEGDLMLHGVHLFDRVNELRKGKLVNDMDKMVISVGRDYLRRIHKYIEKTPEFKVPAVLCRDSNRLGNSSERWEIRLRREESNVSESQDGQQEKQPAQAQNEQPQQQQQNQNQNQAQNNPAQGQAGGAVKPQQNDPIVPSNGTHENVTEAPLANKFNNQFETEREEFYNRMGENFARLLLKRYRKEKLDKEESDYLDRWLSDESVHYGVAAIYCHDGENIKETGKRIATFIDEKQQ